MLDQCIRVCTGLGWRLIYGQFGAKTGFWPVAARPRGRV